ncbi:CRISPR-associated endoribonuclease Cas2 [Paraliobacillus ryukyuensis]|uniref:CRISPR-associated endoribonuclease Cas2 n=1 Tax=Paraliobacillus ryukyuensis TaxID=200904 RepID=A0A366DZ94_9BACI|nr:CRISPR-associated endonuclease Cas2 [Paraliobacillus ryukyuensis]RBO95392.1 CRISPR-associated Cas2 family protein [Paraliobacillus ryukyuensis]
MFDLPVETKTQRRTYSKFRKELIRHGFLMMQYSIYVKSCLNKEAAEGTVNLVKRFLPRDGHVRSIIITEKQFEKMNILVGEEDRNISILGDNRTIEF